MVASWYGTSHFQWDIIARKMKFLAQKKLTELFSGGKWKSLGDLLDVYKGSFGVPYVSIAFRIIYQAVTYSIKIVLKFCKIHWKIPSILLEFYTVHQSSHSLEQL